MAPPKTRDRIVAESLALFNSQGERNVTTNHIAAHLGMSPGNLYYHFRNKQMIIAELFAQYEVHYRFLHRDLEHLLESDAELAERYRAFAQRCLVGAQSIYQGFVEAGILLMTPAQIEALTLNAWIIMTSWVRFLCTAGASPDNLSQDMLRRGIYQVLALEGGYIAPSARAAVEALYGRLHVPLEQVL
ncbi:MAG: TetR family transcriptional regulator [Gammaproteobacteria bacterium HGW-Gammaproteobacteria-12]|nr:MAG: TetR family transcriptional regulator [Gammaproteobacteria bacterium HGW-Gammaproteobacteria-12]